MNLDFIKLDKVDALIFGGLIMAGSGLWLIDPAKALIAVGTVLFALGIYYGGR